MIVYVAFGGMKATTWVQVIKACLLLVGRDLAGPGRPLALQLQSRCDVRASRRGSSEGRRHHGPGRLREGSRLDHLARLGPDVRHRRPAPHPHALLHGRGRQGGPEVGVLCHWPDRLLLRPDLRDRIWGDHLSHARCELLQARGRRPLRQDQGPDRRRQHAGHPSRECGRRFAVPGLHLGRRLCDHPGGGGRSHARRRLGGEPRSLRLGDRPGTDDRAARGPTSPRSRRW